MKSNSFSEWVSLLFSLGLMVSLFVGCQKPTANSGPNDSVPSVEKAPPTSSAFRPEEKSPTEQKSGQQAWFEEIKTTGIQFEFSSGRSDGEFAIIESLGGGVGVIDFDKDGRPDLLFAGGGTLANKTVSSLPCGLFRNLGEMRFEEVTQAAGTSARECFTHGIFPADLDNDGFDDVAISGYGGVQILHNQGDGTFLAMPLLVTHPEFPWSSSLAWADFDRDGALDLYVAHYVNWSWNHHPSCAGAVVPREVCAPRDFAAIGDAIFFGDGAGGFRREDRSIGLLDAGKGLGVVASDIDLDGDVDIYVANDTTDNFLYINDGTGHFQESAVLAGVAGDERGVSTGSMGTLVFDSDQDGLPDIWTVNFERELFGLYRNDGGGLFTHVSRAVGLASIGGDFVGFGTVAIDYDQDGDLDLVVSNGHVSYASPNAPFKQLPVLLENKGGRFSRVHSSQDYFATSHSGRGLATADLDGDGVLDLVVSHLEEPVSVLRGHCKVSNPAIKLHLIGTVSNRNAIGAVVRLSEKRILMHNGGGSYLSSSDPAIWLTALTPGAQQQFQVVWPSGKENDYVVSSDVGEFTIVEPMLP